MVMLSKTTPDSAEAAPAYICSLSGGGRDWAAPI